MVVVRVIVRVGGGKGRVVVRMGGGRGRVAVRVGGEKRKENLYVVSVSHSRWYCWSLSLEWTPGEGLGLSHSVHHSWQTLLKKKI